MSEKYTVGEFWLSQRKNRENWYITWYNQEKRRNDYASTGTGNLQTAKLIINKHFIDHGIIEDTTGEIMLDELLIRYYQKYALIETKRPDVIRYSLKYWSDYFVNATLSKVDHKSIDKFILHLQKQGKANGTINRILCDGRSALNRAYKYGEIAAAPFIKSLPKGKPFKFRPTAKQIAKFIDACDTERMFRYIIIRLCTACRGDAVFDLTLDQINFEDNLIDLNPQGREQTKKYRPIVPMSPTLKFWLKQWNDCEYLINYKDQRVKSNKKAFVATRERAELPELFIGKSIRHVVATELRRQRVDRWEVSGLLGHSTGTTTDDYAIYDPKYLSQAIEAIEVFMLKIQKYCSRQILSKKAMRDNCVTNKKPFVKTGIYRIK